MKAKELRKRLAVSMRTGRVLIRFGTDREAQAMQQSLYDYAPRSNPAQDYKTLYEMIMEG